MDGFKIKKDNLQSPAQPDEQLNNSVAQEAVAPTDSISEEKKPDKPAKVPPHHRLKWIFFKPEHVSRKKWLLIDLAILILVGVTVLGCALIYQHFTKVEPLPKVAQIKREPPKPKTEPSHLTGIEVDPALNQRPVTGVMIENSPDARPQSGLRDAGVVVEAIAEGGITRFLALYQEAQPDYIGPVRSVRPYYLDFVLAFNASIAHVGGSPEALGQVKGLKVRDLDQFANAGAYHRITQRYAPHNMYTSMAKLDALNRSKGFKSSTFDSFPRKKKEQPSKTPTATTINMAISSFYYNSTYKYNPTTNSYLRSEGGAPHTDERTKKQLEPKVLVALVMSYSIQRDGKHSTYGTVGSGPAFVFQDGIVVKGTWHKATRSTQLTLTDAAGKPIELNAGQTWISLVGSSGAITYK